MSPATRSRLSLSRPQAVLVCVTAVATALTCGGLCAAAILVPAPAGVVPLVAVCCIGLPMFAVWQVPSAVRVLRERHHRHKAALVELRRSLDELPEIDHPLGL